MSDIKTYITYFDDAQIEQYNLKADDNTVLFKGNDTSYSGDSINDLNVFYCELCTMYYIWKNNLRSDYIVLKQYRRPFDWESADKLPELGELICYDSIYLVCGSVLQQYAICHGTKRAAVLLDVIGEICGVNSNEYNYFTKGRIMYTNNTMVINWEDFVKMCEFVFNITDAIDSKLKLNYTYNKYMANSKEYTQDGRYDYQTHWMAYIGERLVSCYIATKMHPIPIQRLEGNGFYMPYKKN